MKKCKTCGLPLWMAWLMISWPWTKRERTLKKAEDCIHLLPQKITNKIRAEIANEKE